MPYVETPSYRDNPALRRSRRFHRLADRAIALKDEMAERENEYEEIRQKLLPELIEADATRVEYNGAQIGIVNRKASKRLNKDKLIAALESRGIDLSVLDEAYEPTEASTYVEVRTAKSEQQKTAERVARTLRRSGGAE